LEVKELDKYIYDFVNQTITIIQYIDWKRRHPNKQIENVGEILK